jgi:broad specificity phosphatase PhoE
VDVPLSKLGEQQAAALGRWFAAMPDDDKPNIVLTSPYLRARHTAEIVAHSAGLRMMRIHSSWTNACVKRNLEFSIG